MGINLKTLQEIEDAAEKAVHDDSLPFPIREAMLALEVSVTRLRAYYSRKDWGNSTKFTGAFGQGHYYHDCRSNSHNGMGVGGL
jgi:hypothetical protein